MANIFRRILWHVNRSPAAHVVKWVLRQTAAEQLAVRRRLVEALPVDPAIELAAEILKREGYAQLNNLVECEALQSLAVAGEAKLARVKEAVQKQTSAHKDFWVRLLDEDMYEGVLPSDNPFVRFALQTKIIGVVARALGELPLLDYVLLTLSRGDSPGLSYSQLWHRDHDDVRTIKLFVYLTDVQDESDGPFTFLPGPVSDRFGFSLRSHRHDDEILPKVRAGEVRAMVAPRLTTFMVETSRCLHMGSRVVPGHSRLLYTATFITMPRLFPEPPLRFRLAGSESELEKCILSARLLL